jgi:hypothetical protein
MRELFGGAGLFNEVRLGPREGGILKKPFQDWRPHMERRNVRTSAKDRRQDEKQECGRREAG